jgi:dTDP-glucose 4,6-dehydratase/UDP-glucose 4-epimerase
MKILIIGSKGFIGQHAEEYFTKKEYSVFGCDVVTDYAAENYFLIDTSNSDFHFIFENHKFEVCINCSGAADVSASVSNPTRDFSLNTINVFKILDAIRIHQPECKFINLSSAAVYGNPQYLPIDENHPLNPISPYGCHKLFSEQICKEFTDIYKLKTCNLRVFSAFGEGLKKQLFWDLYKKSLSAKKIVLFGTGSETRDFIYIRDLMQVLELVIKNAEFKGESINVANGEEISVKEAAQLFYENLDSDITLEFSGNNQPCNPINWKAEITTLKNYGYKPEFTITQGLEIYKTWLKGLEY